MSVALVTGGNRGIGFELCRQLKDKGWDVIGTSRAPSENLEKIGIQAEILDIGDQGSIFELTQRLAAGPKIDILINNAGVSIRNHVNDIDSDSIKRQFDVNALGPLLLASSLLPQMAENSKIAMITSRMGSIADNGSGSHYGYRMSKAALNAASVSLALDIRDRGIAVAILHPGFVKTDMTEGRGDITPDVSASRLLERIDELSLETSARFLHANGQELPW